MPSDFALAVYARLRQVPAGQVTTYGELAKALGKPKAARAVGQALHRNPYSYLSLAPEALLVPCHRVVASKGRLGGFAFPDSDKVQLLAGEGVAVTAGRVLDFTQKMYYFDKL